MSRMRFRRPEVGDRGQRGGDEGRGAGALGEKAAEQQRNARCRGRTEGAEREQDEAAQHDGAPPEPFRGDAGGQVDGEARAAEGAERVKRSQNEQGGG